MADLSTTNDTDLSQVLAIPFNELPMHINEVDEFKRQMVLARLRKEDLRANYKFVTQSLWDYSFDVEDYRQIGHNDGVLNTLALIFKELEDTRHEQECYDWVYSTLALIFKELEDTRHEKECYDWVYSD